MSLIQRLLCQVYTTIYFNKIKNKISLFCKGVYYRKAKKTYEATAETFLYFAYGSNLLKKRIRINNASAEFLGIGRLENYQLDFATYSSTWRGATATIVPKENVHLWGAIWRLNNNDIPALDKQEGVDTNWYCAKTVDVVTRDCYMVQCRTYQLTVSPPLRKDGEELPMGSRPSMTYLDVIINGAKECGIPADYIKQLKKIPHNGQRALPKMI